MPRDAALPIPISRRPARAPARHRCPEEPPPLPPPRTRPPRPPLLSALHSALQTTRWLQLYLVHAIARGHASARALDRFGGPAADPIHRGLRELPMARRASLGHRFSPRPRPGPSTPGSPSRRARAHPTQRWAPTTCQIRCFDCLLAPQPCRHPSSPLPAPHRTASQPHQSTAGHSPYHSRPCCANGLFPAEIIRITIRQAAGYACPGAVLWPAQTCNNNADVHPAHCTFPPAPHARCSACEIRGVPAH